MICASCTEIIEVLHFFNIDINEVGKGYLSASQTNCYCRKCSKEINSDEDCFENDDDLEIFIGKAIIAIAEKVSDNIEFCSFCEGSDIEQYYYNIYKEFGDGGFNLERSGMDIVDFLYDYGIPDRYHSEIAKVLICQNCSYGREPYDPKHNPSGGQFELEDRIYTKHDINSFYGMDTDEFFKLSSLYGIEFVDEMELENYVDYIFKNPLLAHKHEIGKRIYDVLKLYYTNNDYEVINVGEKLYRGITRKVNDKKRTLDEMWQPPHGSSRHGRYNLVGVSVLYCANRIEAIPYEIHPNRDQAVDIATFNVNKEMKLLDAESLFKDFQGFINERSAYTTQLMKEYLLTNYIRDCCYEIGFNGIHYKGLCNRGDLEPYDNYALINFIKDETINCISSETYTINICYEMKITDQNLKD